MRFITRSIILILGLALSVFIISCDDGGSDSSSASSTSFGGPGSAWTAQINTDFTFTFTRADTLGGATTLTVNGTYQLLDAGFMKLTVTSASGTNAPSTGATAYGMYVSDFVLLVKPIDSSGDDKIIPMVVSGTCPSSSMNFNWMVTSHEQNGLEDLTDDNDLFGTASWNGSDTMSVNTQYAIDDGSTDLLGGSPQNMTGSCSNGQISLTGVADLWISASEAALVKTSGGGVIVAMPQETISAASDMDGNYYGLMFDDTQSEKVQPIWVSINTSGTSQGGGYTDVDNNTKDSAAVTLSSFSINYGQNGFFKMNVNDGSNNDDLVCQTASNIGSSSKRMMFCVGAAPGSSGQNLYNILVVSE